MLYYIILYFILILKCVFCLSVRPSPTTRPISNLSTVLECSHQVEKENNYVETLFGRVIHTPEINAKGPMAGFAKRAAINAPIQGTAADIIRRAMIRVPEAIKDLPAKMLLQVHDELLFEVKEEFCEDLIVQVRSIMEAASLPFLKMDIPLSVDAGRGMNWAEAH